MVIAPLSTVLTQTFSSVSAKRDDVGSVVELPTEFETAGPGKNRGDRIGRCCLALLVHTIVAGHGAVRRFRLDGLAIGREQNRGHQAKRSEALGNLIRLHIAIIIFARPYELARPFQRRRDHIIN